MIVTASLTTGIACVAVGSVEALRLMEGVLRTDHRDWETTLYVGDVEFHQSKDGPFPNHQVRISVRPSMRCAALSYIDHDDKLMSVALSFNPKPLGVDPHLVFNGATGAVFPRSAAIPVDDARNALTEWLATRCRPTSIRWAPFDYI